MNFYECFQTKYFLCKTTNLEGNQTKYSCKVFNTNEESIMKKNDLEKENNQKYFITKTIGPMFYRQIQIQQNFNQNLIK